MKKIFNIVALAKEKGFVSTVIGKSVTAKYTSKPFYYLWLCELQKWLREEHSIHVEVSNEGFNLKEDLCFQHLVDYNTLDYKSSNKIINEMNLAEDIKFKTYEETLERGLQEALKLIEND